MIWTTVDENDVYHITEQCLLFKKEAYLLKKSIVNKIIRGVKHYTIILINVKSIINK